MSTPDREAALTAAAELPDLPRDDDGPVFAAPWQAQAAGDPDRGDTFYRHWLATLERMVAEKGVTSTESLNRTRDAWDRAADRTPHGTPIVLTRADFSA